MSKHLFGMILTGQGIYANNRGEGEGITNTLQKVFRKGELYTTVSSESIRYALREGWQESGRRLNRTLSDHRSSTYKDRDFENWWKYLDDDILGYMHASQETRSRRGILEITRAISTTPWRGEVMQNFASPGSNPGVSHDNPIPYAVEVHDTRYQFGFAMTPEFMGRQGMQDKDSLKMSEKRKRLQYVLEGLINLRRVGGSHARYMTDYSPEIIVFRWTDDPAPRFLNCFDQDEQGAISLRQLLKKIKGGDIEPNEVIIGASCDFDEAATLEDEGVCIKAGVKLALERLLEIVQDRELCP